jgi:hypothetical protein
LDQKSGLLFLKQLSRRNDRAVDCQTDSLVENTSRETAPRHPFAYDQATSICRFHDRGAVSIARKGSEQLQSTAKTGPFVQPEKLNTNPLSDLLRRIPFPGKTPPRTTAPRLRGTAHTNQGGALRTTRMEKR